MKLWILAAAIFLFSLGCDSENKKTYEFKGYWTFSGLSDLCQQPLPDAYGGGNLSFDTIVVEVFESEADMEAGEVYRDTTVDCSDGTFTIDDLERGTYFVTVSAMAADPTDEIVLDAGVDASVELDDDGPEVRAYYQSTEEVVVPSKDDEAVEFEMKIGTGSIEVTWDFESGQCNSDWNQVATVSIEVKGQSRGNPYDSGELDCTDSKWKVDDLPWDVYSVTIEGFDEDGNKTHEGAFENPVELRPGTHISGRDGLIVLFEE